VVELTTMRGFTATVSLVAAESLPQAATIVTAAMHKGKDLETRTADEVRPRRFRSTGRSGGFAQSVGTASVGADTLATR
jgi:hypothetical protein